MPTPNFLGSPRFQEIMRRRINLDPYQRAVPTSEDIVANFGEKQAGRETYGLGRSLELGNREARLKSSTDIFNKRLALEKGQFDKGMALQQDQLSDQSSLGRLGLGLGAVNVGLSGLGAYSNIKASEKEAAQYNDLANSFMELLNLEIENRKRIG